MVIMARHLRSAAARRAFAQRTHDERKAMPNSPPPDQQPDDPILQFFAYEHLPMLLQERSKPFAVLAHHVANNYPRNPERTVALRKLLEAKDAAVRAAIYK